MTKYLTYTYPIEDSQKELQIGRETHSEQECIEIQKQTAKLVADYDYVDNERALEDYISVNWAYYTDEYGEPE